MRSYVYSQYARVLFNSIGSCGDFGFAKNNEKKKGKIIPVFTLNTDEENNLNSLHKYT